METLFKKAGKRFGNMKYFSYLYYINKKERLWIL